MTVHKHLWKVAVVAAVGSLFLAACSSASGTSPTDAGTPAAATTTGPPAAAGGGTQVAVTLGENDVMSQYMKLDQTTLPSGKVTFTVTNEGVKKHEFVVMSTDTPTSKLTVKGDEVVEDDYAAVDEIGDIPAGTTGTLTVDLKPGHYALICNFKGHYRMGMRADITVQ